MQEIKFCAYDKQAKLDESEEETDALEWCIRLDNNRSFLDNACDNGMGHDKPKYKRAEKK